MIAIVAQNHSFILLVERFHWKNGGLLALFANQRWIRHDSIVWGLGIGIEHGWYYFVLGQFVQGYEKDAEVAKAVTEHLPIQAVIIDHT